MKEKILQQLKIKRGENTSPSDRTLETLASSLSAVISEETDISAMIETFSPVLDAIPGEVSAVAAKAVRDAKPATPPANPPANPPATPPANDEPAWFKAYKEAQDRMALETKQRLESISNAKQTETLVAKAKTDFYTKYQVNDAEKALCEKSLDIHLKMNPTPESAEKLIEGWKTQYEDLRQVQGLGALVPAGSGGNGGADTAGKQALNTLKEKLQREGKIPTPAQN